MYFNVYENYGEMIKAPGQCSLVSSGWDDDGYQTEYELFYHERLKTTSIGYVKIGCRGQENVAAVVLPEGFVQLPEGFFSVGQEEEYYDELNRKGEKFRVEILKALRDVAFDLTLFDKYLDQGVMRDSLLRSVTLFTVRHQFHRMAHGGVRLCEYSFSYKVQCDPDHEELGQNCMDFHVVPDSDPPSNVHVLIGRNGTGKTRMIKDMILGIRGGQEARGSFVYASETDTRETFANVVCTAFSPFDDFSGLDQVESSLPYSYVGLNKNSGDLAKSIEEQFYAAFSNCMISKQKRELWSSAIGILQEGDTTFAETDILQLVQGNGFQFRIPHPEKVAEIFSPLSSGHKVVLLTVTSCVDRIEERSILFLDEPENHLHPPLLAALIRTLSDLLIKRNGVAIISTHSPVVLQEVPDNCVWKLFRKNKHLVARRPAIQTFGETIGALTKDVFGLDVMASGFHKILRDDVDQFGDYDVIYERYNGKLGTEAELLLRTMLLARELGETK